MVRDFVLSLVVAIISGPLLNLLTHRAAIAIHDHVELAYQLAYGPLSVEPPYLTAPSFIKAYIGQAIDVATGFGAAILTLVAYTHLYDFSIENQWVPILAAVMISVTCMLFASPKFAVFYTATTWRVLGGISVLSLAVIVANVVGLFLAVIA